MWVAQRVHIAHRARDLALWDLEDACLNRRIDVTVGTDLHLRVATLRDERWQPANLQLAADRDQDISLLQLQDEARFGFDKVRILIPA
jgi:hypothetical protein